MSNLVLPAFQAHFWLESRRLLQAHTSLDKTDRCGRLPHDEIMAKSIRVSDALYNAAAAAGALMHRSLAQQVEHWATVGQGMEASHSAFEVSQAALAALYERDDMRVRSGELHPWQLGAIPERMVKEAKLTYPDDAQFEQWADSL